MDILEHSFRLILRAHSQILLIFVSPELRQLLHVQIFLYQHLLNLIADQHMETVAQFIGLGAD